MEIDDDDDDEAIPSYQSRPAAETHDGPPITFKDLVERRAIQRNLVFLPKGRQFNGKVSLYRNSCLLSVWFELMNFKYISISRMNSGLVFFVKVENPVCLFRFIQRLLIKAFNLEGK